MAEPSGAGEASSAGGGAGRNFTNQPDPTARTNQQIDAGLANLRAILEARLDAMDKAINVLEKYPTSVDIAVGNLRDLLISKIDGLDRVMQEKFNGIGKQFQLNDLALNAALSTAKEAVSEQNRSSATAISKSEAATDKRIDQMGSIMNATNNGLNDKIDDLKTRISASETSRTNNVISSNMTPVYIIGGIAVLLLVVVVVYNVMRGVGVQ